MLKPNFQEPVPDGKRRRLKNRRPLSTQDRICIVHKVYVEHEKHADVAREYRVSTQVVASLMLRARRNHAFLREIMHSDQCDVEEREYIKSTVQISNDFGRIVDSAKAVADGINADGRKPVSENTVRSVMRDDLDMRYRKIKTVSLHSNSARNLVLRQRWALEFLT